MTKTTLAAMLIAKSVDYEAEMQDLRTQYAERKLDNATYIAKLERLAGKLEMIEETLRMIDSTIEYK